MLKFIPDHVKTKKMCKHAVKKLPFLIRYVPDQHETQQMCDKAILNNGRASKSVPDCYKINNCVLKLLTITVMRSNLFLNAIRLKKFCYKAVNAHPSTIQFVPECYKT